MNVITFIELALDVRQCNHDCQILPHIAISKLQGLSHQRWSTNTSTRSFAAFDPEHSFAFEAVEVLGETPTVCFQVSPLDGEH